MPRFYFDTDDGSCSVTDGDSIDLQDMQSVQEQALALLYDISRERQVSELGRRFVTAVRDRHGHPVLKITLKIETPAMAPVSSKVSAH
jgi:hypothetical protein